MIEKVDRLEPANYRISKSAWLFNADDSNLLATIDKRIKDMTHLSLDTAEPLQIVNYGIGGQYEPHFDFGLPDEIISYDEDGIGNRIATVLFYVRFLENSLLKEKVWPFF